MARSLKWRELKTGVVALAVIIGLAVSVLLFARVGAMHGDTTDIYVVTREAPGVLNGTDVWLSGQKVGQVRDVHFRPVTADTMQRLAIHLQILSSRMHFIRKNSYADIRPGDNLIGSPVVWISSGTSAARALRAGDTLIEISTGKMKPVGERVGSLIGRLTVLADSGGQVLHLLNSQVGTLGKLAGPGIPKIAAATGKLATFGTKARTGNGSVALIMNGDIRARVARIRAVKDSITQMLTSGTGNVGRFRRDSTLTRDVAHLRLQIDSLNGLFSGSNGLTRLKSDTALKAEIARVRVELAALMADLKKHPLRYLKP